MSTESWIAVALSVAALTVMALAATVDAMTGPISRQRLRQYAVEQGGGQRAIQALLDPRRSLSASLLMIQVVSVAIAASLLTSTFRREVDQSVNLLAIVVVSTVFLFFGQALPRALAVRRPDRAIVFLISVAGLLVVLARPLSLAVELVAGLLMRLMPTNVSAVEQAGPDEEYRGISFAGEDDDVIEADEREMIDGVLHLEERTVRDIMVPRVDIIAVNRSVPSRELVQTIIGAGHSRIPVYQETIDDIIGILYAKDLLRFVIGTTDRVPLLDLIRPAYVVPESKRLDDLLKELRRAKVHIAIVADEYGGTAGLVTIEDILEEIVGEIQDEYDTELPLFEVVNEAELVADGRLPLEDVEETLRLKFTEDDDFGTLGGFVHKHLGRMPKDGDRFDAEGVHVEVIAVEGHRVRKLRVVKHQSDTDSSPVASPHNVMPTTANGVAPAPHER